MKPITLDIKGIKCDAPLCDYKDMTVAFDMEKYHNAPCPKCGANLFTDADYKAMKKMLHRIKVINFIFSPFMHKLDAKVHRFKMDMNGTGEVKVTKDPV